MDRVDQAHGGGSTISTWDPRHEYQHAAASAEHSRNYEEKAAQNCSAFPPRGVGEDNTVVRQQGVSLAIHLRRKPARRETINHSRHPRQGANDPPALRRFFQGRSLSYLGERS